MNQTNKNTFSVFGVFRGLIAIHIGLFCVSVFAAPLEWHETAPAANWQEASLTGNGTIGAMVEGRLEDERIHLSHCKLYLPEPGTNAPSLQGRAKPQPGDYVERDGYMAACDLKIATPLRGATDYSRSTDFRTGEVIVEARDAKGKKYRRSVCAVRGANVIAVKVEDEGGRNPVAMLCGIEPNGRGDVQAFAKGVKEIVSRPDYYRCEFANENPWNEVKGYEVFLTQSRRGAEVAEIFVAIVPKMGNGEWGTGNGDAPEFLLAAAEKGYDGAPSKARYN